MEKVIFRFISVAMVFAIILSSVSDFPNIALATPGNYIDYLAKYPDATPVVSASQLAETGAVQNRWLSLPYSRVVVNYFTESNNPQYDVADYEKQFSNRPSLPLNIGYLYPNALYYGEKLNDLMVMYSKATQLSSASSYSTSWAPHKLDLTGSYSNGISLSGFDYFNETNAVVRSLNFSNITTSNKNYVIGGKYNGTVTASGNTLAISSANSKYAVTIGSTNITFSYYATENNFIARTNASSTPSASGYWSADIDLSALISGKLIVAVKFPDSNETISQIIADAKTIQTADHAAGINNREKQWNNFLAAVPNPANFSLGSLTTPQVTADQVKKQYYKAWCFMAQDILPNNEELSYNYPQFACGKPSMWAYGAAKAPYTSAWESLLAMQTFSQVDPEVAVQAFKGVISLIDSSGVLAGESLPTVKAQTAAVIYKNSGDISVLTETYDNLKKGVEWSRDNPRWLFGGQSLDVYDSDFAVSAIMDLAHMVDIASILGKYEDVKYWDNSIDSYVNDKCFKWFWELPESIPGQYYNANTETRSQDPLNCIVPNALIVPNIKGIRLEGILNAFSSAFKPDDYNAGFSGNKYPNQRLTVLGLIKQGHITEARKYIDSSIRDVVLSCSFSEVVQNSGGTIHASGVKPSVFSAELLIDFIQLKNGLDTSNSKLRLVNTAFTTNESIGVSNITISGKKINISKASGSNVFQITGNVSYSTTITQGNSADFKKAVITSISDQVMNANSNRTLTVTVDTSTAILKAFSSNASATTVSISGNILTINSLSTGQSVITVVAYADGYSYDIKQFMVKVAMSSSPQITLGSISNLTINRGEVMTKYVDCNITGATISASSNNGNVSAAVENGSLVVTAIDKTTTDATITVSCSKPGYTTGTRTFTAKVNYPDTLASMPMQADSTWATGGETPPTLSFDNGMVQLAGNGTWGGYFKSIPGFDPNVYQTIEIDVASITTNGSGYFLVKLTAGDGSVLDEEVINKNIAGKFSFDISTLSAPKKLAIKTFGIHFGVYAMGYAVVKVRSFKILKEIVETMPMETDSTWVTGGATPPTLSFDSGMVQLDGNGTWGGYFKSIAGFDPDVYQTIEIDVASITTNGAGYFEVNATTMDNPASVNINLIRKTTEGKYSYDLSTLTAQQKSEIKTHGINFGVYVMENAVVKIRSFKICREKSLSMPMRPDSTWATGGVTPPSVSFVDGMAQLSGTGIWGWYIKKEAVVVDPDVCRIIEIDVASMTGSGSYVLKLTAGDGSALNEEIISKNIAGKFSFDMSKLSASKKSAIKIHGINFGIYVIGNAVVKIRSLNIYKDFIVSMPTQAYPSWSSWGATPPVMSFVASMVQMTGTGSWGAFSKNISAFDPDVYKIIEVDVVSFTGNGSYQVKLTAGDGSVLNEEVISKTIAGKFYFDMSTLSEVKKTAIKTYGICFGLYVTGNSVVKLRSLRICKSPTFSMPTEADGSWTAWGDAPPVVTFADDMVQIVSTGSWGAYSKNISGFDPDIYNTIEIDIASITTNTNGSCLVKLTAGNGSILDKPVILKNVSGKFRFNISSLSTTEKNAIRTYGIYFGIFVLNGAVIKVRSLKIFTDEEASMPMQTDSNWTAGGATTPTVSYVDGMVQLTGTGQWGGYLKQLEGFDPDVYKVIEIDVASISGSGYYEINATTLDNPPSVNINLIRKNIAGKYSYDLSTLTVQQRATIKAYGLNFGVYVIGSPVIKIRSMNIRNMIIPESVAVNFLNYKVSSDNLISNIELGSTASSFKNGNIVQLTGTGQWGGYFKQIAGFDPDLYKTIEIDVESLTTNGNGYYEVNATTLDNPASVNINLIRKDIAGKFSYDLSSLSTQQKAAIKAYGLNFGVYTIGSPSLKIRGLSISKDGSDFPGIYESMPMQSDSMWAAGGATPPIIRYYGLSAGTDIVKIKDKSGNGMELAENYLVTTGTIVEVTNGTATTNYKIVIFGDVNGTGDIDISDLTAIKSHLLKINLLDNLTLKAGDTSGKSSVTISDLLAIKKSILGIGSGIDQNHG